MRRRPHLLLTFLVALTAVAMRWLWPAPAAPFPLHKSGDALRSMVLPRCDKLGITEADLQRRRGDQQAPKVPLVALHLPPISPSSAICAVGLYCDAALALVARMPHRKPALAGTVDIAISLSQYLPRAEVYVVITPQPAAQKLARLSAAMADKVNLPVKGIIENMSWFTGDDGKRYEIFGSGGGDLLAQELEVPLLGKLPLVPELREGGDTGRPSTAVEPDSEAARMFQELATKIAVDMKPKKVFSEKLKKTLNAYHTRAISTMQVIEELIQLAKELDAVTKRGATE